MGSQCAERHEPLGRLKLKIKVWLVSVLLQLLAADPCSLVHKNLRRTVKPTTPGYDYFILLYFLYQAFRWIKVTHVGSTGHRDKYSIFYEFLFFT